MVAMGALASTAWAQAAGGREPALATVRLPEVIVTARKVEENARYVPIAISVLPRDRLETYRVSTLETVAGLTPDLIITRGNSGSGADISLRGIGSNFSSIGIEQSVAVVVDDVYYGQGRIIDEAFLDLGQISIAKGPQALLYGKNSTAGVIAISTADPGANFEGRVRLGYDFSNEAPKGEAMVSGPLGKDLRVRLVVGGEDMRGGAVRNAAPPGVYTTVDAATFAVTQHPVPAPSDRRAPGDRNIMARLTAIYGPVEGFTATLKASVDHDESAGTSWNDVAWKCPGGVTAFPGSGQPCGERFEIEQNPAPPDIAATRPDMRRHGGQLYTLYDSHSVTLRLSRALGWADLTSVSNYQDYRYATNSDYDFTRSPLIWADQDNKYRAVSEEARLRTAFSGPLNLLAGVYYQSTRLDFHQAAVFFGSENSLAAPQDRYVSVSKLSATDGATVAGYGQVIWALRPDLELTAGARYTTEKKDSFFIQPYVNPFFQVLYVQGDRLTARQRFHNLSPEATLTWKQSPDVTVYAAFKTGYKSGGFSNSADEVVGGSGVKNLAFKPETAKGGEVGLKALWLDRGLRVNADAYRYEVSDMQVDFFNSANFALITTNAGSALTQGVEAEAEYRPAQLPDLTLRGALQYNRARYRHYLGPCYAGQTQQAGCNRLGPPPENAPLQELGGKPTADSPEWTGSIGADYGRRLSGNLRLGLSIDLRFSSRYSASPFGQPLDIQPAYANLDAALRVGDEAGRWSLALIGKNLTNNFVVTYASDAPSTGSPPGGSTGILADQTGLFAPPRTVELQFTARL